MRMTRVWLAGLALAGLVSLGYRPAPAEETKEKAAKEGVDKDAAKVGEAVRNIALASDLATLGREQKSPEMLIAAAKILRKIQARPGTEKPKIEKGEDTATEPISLVAESDSLLEEARKLAKETDNQLCVELADKVAKEPKSRGSLGGPRSYTHQPGAGTVITWNVTFRGGQPANVSVRGNGRNVLTLTVTGPGGHFYTWTGPNPAVNWVPNVQKTYTITVRNDGPGACRYTLFHN